MSTTTIHNDITASLQTDMNGLRNGSENTRVDAQMIKLKTDINTMESQLFHASRVCWVLFVYERL